MKKKSSQAIDINLSIPSGKLHSCFKVFSFFGCYSSCLYNSYSGRIEWESNTIRLQNKSNFIFIFLLL